MLIKEYQESWKNDFEEIKKIILKGLNNPELKMEHAGSTAIEGLSAKPIIDLDLIYFQSGEFYQIRTKLEELGYYHNGDQGISGREVFKRAKDQDHSILDSISHHLYVCVDGAEELRRHLLFRDKLMADKNLAKEYEELKMKLALKANQNRKVYAQLKETEAKAFFEKILK